MKTAQETKVKEMLQESKIFISEFDGIISKLTEKEIQKYRNNLSKEII